jgi:hypothetical protein
MARFKGGGLEKSIASKLAADINNRLAVSIQESAVAITNGLAEAGPAWTGEFAASWDVVPEGQAARQPRSSGGQLYQYTKRNFPASRFQKALERGVTQFQVINTSPHAAQAMDEVTDIFTRPDSDPIKTPELGDYRPRPSFRYEIGGSFAGLLKDAPAARTAEPDWFYTYAKGGSLQLDVRRGIELGFKSNYSF